MDLKNEFSNINGFSRSNLFAMQKFYLFHNQNDIIIQQLVGQMGSKKMPIHNIAQLVQEFESSNLIVYKKL